MGGLARKGRGNAVNV